MSGRSGTLPEVFLSLNIELFSLTRSSDPEPGTATCEPSVTAHDWSEHAHV